jgi:SAM-dependent methyltransferase
METLTECPLCGTRLTADTPRWQVGDWSIVTCAGCGVGLTNPRPTLAEIGQYYRASFFLVRPDAKVLPATRDLLTGRIKPGTFVTTLRSIVLSEVKYRHDWTLQGGALRRRLLAPLRRALALTYEPIQTLPGTPGTVLDIGFGRGEFLLRAQRLGWKCHGVEVSATSVEWGRQLGFEAQQFDGSFLAPLNHAPASFDVVSANSVLEHVHHPRRLVAEAHRLLKPGGKLLLMVPNFACRDTRTLREHWRMWSPPQHLFHFTPANVHTLLQQHGFERIAIRFKVWFNPMTEKLSLRSLRPTVSRSRYLRAAWQLRIGKRLDYLRGRLTAAEVAPGMAIEAVKR